MQHDSDDHEDEEDVERNRNRKIWSGEIGDDGDLEGFIRSHGLADDHQYTHRYVNGANFECYVPLNFRGPR